MTAEQTTRIEKMEAELHEQRQIFIRGKSQCLTQRSAVRTAIRGNLIGTSSENFSVAETVWRVLFQKWEKYEGFYWDQEGLLVNLYHQILLAIHFELCA